MTFNVYRKEKNDLNPPVAIATGLTNKEFEDTTLSKDTAYLVSVSAEKNGIEKVSDELLVYLASEFEDSGYLLPRVKSFVYDYAISTADYQATISSASDWLSTDYIVFSSFSTSETVTPPAGINLLYTKQHATIANAYLHVFGGVKGSVSAFSFNYSTSSVGSVFTITARAIENIESFEDVVLSTQSGLNFNEISINRDTDDIFLVSTFGFNFASPVITTPIRSPLTNNWSWSGTGLIRANYIETDRAAQGLGVAKTTYFTLNATQNLEIATLVFKRKAGARPPITYNKTPLQSQISASKGYAYAFLKNGEIVEIVTGGVEKTGGNAVTENTVFQLASISKLITELAVRKLEEDGLLTLDDTIDQHLSDYTFGANVANITIRNLLQMKSGISAAFNIFAKNWQQETRDWLTNTSSNAGKIYSYNNACFAVIQLIINSIVGDYVDYVQSNILRKLGIYDATNDATTLSIKNYSASYTEVDPVDLTCTASAGWCMSLISLSKIAKTLRYSIILNNQSKMKEDRYRMISLMSARGEMFQHDGGINQPITAAGIKAQYMYGCDGYDVIALTNTNLTSTMIVACRDALSV